MKHINYLIIAIMLLLSPLNHLTQAEETAGTPSAYFPETDYRFQPVLTGTAVSHTFTFQNKGTAVLKIQKVGTG